MAQDDLAQIRDEFVEKIGVIAQAEGLPRIAGRLFGLMLFEGRRFSFGELAERLQVSRGSVSTSVRMLEDRSILKRVSEPGDRQAYFQLSNIPYAELLGAAAVRARASRADIAKTIEKLPEDAVGPRARLRDYAAFYEAMDVSISLAVKTLTEKKA